MYSIPLISEPFDQLGSLILLQTRPTSNISNIGKVDGKVDSKGIPPRPQEGSHLGHGISHSLEKVTKKKDNKV